MRDSLYVDSLRTLDPLDTLFWPMRQEALSRPVEQTGSRIKLGGGPLAVSLYGLPRYGAAAVVLEPFGCFSLLHAKGVYRKAEHSLWVKLGSRCVTVADTLLYVPPEVKPAMDRVLPTYVKGTFLPALEVHGAMLDELVGVYATQLAPSGPIVALSGPLTIVDSEALEEIPPIVNGPLVLDGTFAPLEWHSRRTVIVRGDLQFTGEVRVEGVRFVVEGETKLFDKGVLKDVSVFSGGRISIGGNAEFTGDAMTLDRVLVYGDARVKGRSTLVAMGRGSRRKRSETDTAGSSAVRITDRATVDGCVVALRSPGSIRVDPDAIVQGVLYAQGDLCHGGTLVGVAKAGRLVDCLEARGAIAGPIEPLEEVVEYPFPPFMGELAILEWHEE
jgi:hypothetical protein